MFEFQQFFLALVFFCIWNIKKKIFNTLTKGGDGALFCSSKLKIKLTRLHNLRTDHKTFFVSKLDNKIQGII